MTLRERVRCRFMAVACCAIAAVASATSVETAGRSWETYFARYPSAAKAPLLGQLGVTLDSSEREAAFARLMGRVRVEPEGLTRDQFDAAIDRYGEQLIAEPNADEEELADVALLRGAIPSLASLLAERRAARVNAALERFQAAWQRKQALAPSDWPQPGSHETPGGRLRPFDHRDWSPSANSAEPPRPDPHIDRPSIDGPSLAADLRDLGRSLRGSARLLLRGAFSRRPAVARRSDFYRAYAQSVADFRAFAEYQYRDGLGIGAKFAALPNAYRALLVDPGVVQRADDFVAFALANHPSKTEPWDMRQRYKRHLGRATFYRALALTESEKDWIMTHGMESRSARSMFQREDGPFSHPVRGQIEAREWGHYWNRKHDALLSVTPTPQVATIVAKHERGWRFWRKTYLFKVELWNLDLLDPNRDRARGLESLVFNGISVDEIKSVELVSEQRLSQDCADLHRLEKQLGYAIAPCS